MATLSVVITTFNEQFNVETTLLSVAWADEILVIDGYSTDNTMQIAEKYTSRVLLAPNHTNLNVNKNTGFMNAHAEWILSLDADEHVSEELADEIRSVISRECEYDAFSIPRRNIFLAKWIHHGNWYPDYQTRLFRRGHGWFACNHVHESLTVNGRMGVMRNHLIHHSYPTISVYFQKFSRYTSFESQALASSQVNRQSVTIGSEYNTRHAQINNQHEAKRWSIFRIAMHFMIFKPILSFVNQYISYKGFLDGWRGLFLAFFSAAYYPVTFLKYLSIRVSNPNRVK